MAQEKSIDEQISGQTEILRLDPTNAWAFQSRGDCYRMKKDYERAIADLSEAIRLCSWSSVSFWRRGDCYRMTKDYERAIVDLSEAIRLDPKNSQAFWSRGDCYRMTKDYDRAIVDLTEAIRLDPTNPLAFGRRGDCYRMIKNYERAIADLSENIRLDPTNSWAIDLLNKANQAKRTELDSKQITTPVPPIAPATTSRRHYLDCPHCGKYYFIDEVNPEQRIDCAECDGWFLVKSGLNLRTTCERVETKGFLQRVWSGSSIQRSKREELVSTAQLYQSFVRNEMLNGNPAQAQVWQLKYNDIMQQIDNL